MMFKHRHHVGLGPGYGGQIGDPDKVKVMVANLETQSGSQKSIKLFASPFPITGSTRGALLLARHSPSLGALTEEGG